MGWEQRRGSWMLLLAAMIWGTTFVAQILGLKHIQPFTFQAVRSLLGAAALLPVILISQAAARKKEGFIQPTAAQRRVLLTGGVLCGLVLFVATNLQQFGLTETSAGKAGFLTALYILIVPLYGLLLGHRVRRAIWLSVLVALIGLYLLTVREGFTVSTGDILLILCAFAFAGQILLVDYYGVRAHGVKLCALQFLVSGVLSVVMMFIFEQPSTGRVLLAWGPLLYAGVLSSGVAYTLQIFAQRTTPPAIASLLMSLEAVFAVLAGMVVLGETLTLRELLGSVLMFAAILFAQRAEPPRPVEGARPVLPGSLLRK